MFPRGPWPREKGLVVYPKRWRTASSRGTGRDSHPTLRIGNLSVSGTSRGHDGLREFWTEYRKTFDEMKSTFRNVFATEEGAALEWITEATSNGDTVSYDGVSILEIEGGKVRRFMAYFDTRDLAPQVVD